MPAGQKLLLSEYRVYIENSTVEYLKVPILS